MGVWEYGGVGVRVLTVRTCRPPQPARLFHMPSLVERYRHASATGQQKAPPPRQNLLYQ